MKLVKNRLYKLGSMLLLGALMFTSVVSPTSATESSNIEYIESMNDTLQEIDEFAAENVQIDYIKEDDQFRETKIISNNEQVITRLNKETNQLEIITENDEAFIINLDEKQKNEQKKSLKAARPNERGSSLLYDGEYSGWYNYSNGKDFWALEWEGNTKSTFENNKNSSNIKDFIQAIDALESKEDNLATALAIGVPSIGVSVVVTAITATPAAKLTLSVLAGIAATLALTATCITIMNDMLPTVRIANRTFYKISIETPKIAPLSDESFEEISTQ
ncbi:geobacillin-26 family protein [Brevibacillus sp. FIR094]|uniref:geobacillin-26 family protein n=1 Tax=Brevibacillus sp. FIR094 TaxID=3134809 RepID=UPI003D2137B2